MNAQEFFNSMRYFGEPKVPEHSTYANILDTYLDGLDHYSKDVLEAASKRILATRNYRNFPLLAECIQACRDVQEEFVEQRMAEKPRLRTGDPWSEGRIRAADRLMNSEIGRLAATEGWTIHLHDFCREQGRLPNHLESERVRREGLAIKAERERLATAGGATNRIVIAVSKAMEAKRDRLRKLVMGEVG